jgi:hypothetical protein
MLQLPTPLAEVARTRGGTRRAPDGGGMTNLVYCIDNNLLKNNYYFAL